MGGMSGSTTGAIIGAAGTAAAGLFSYLGTRQQTKALREQQSEATEKALESLNLSQDDAIQLEKQIFGRIRKDLQPYRSMGIWGLGHLKEMLSQGPGLFKQSPGYGLRMAEGVRAITHGAAGVGSLLSGKTLKDLTTWGQRLASEEYQNWLNQWYQSLTPYMELAGMGQSAAGMTGQLGSNLGQSMANTILGTGQHISNLLLRQGALPTQPSIYGTLGQTVGNIAGNIGNLLTYDYYKKNYPNLYQQPQATGNAGGGAAGVYLPVGWTIR